MSLDSVSLCKDFSLNLSFQEKGNALLLESFLKVEEEKKPSAPQEEEKEPAKVKHSVGKDLRKNLSPVQFLRIAHGMYRIALETIDALSEKTRDLRKLDGLVGERACQIRALMVASFIRTSLSLNDPLSELREKITNKCRDILKEIEMLESSAKRSLHQCFEAVKLDKVPEQIIPSIQAQMLQVAKEKDVIKTAQAMVQSLKAARLTVPKKLAGLFEKELLKCVEKKEESFDLAVPEQLIPLIQARLLQVVDDREEKKKRQLCFDCGQVIPVLSETTDPTRLLPFVTTGLPENLAKATTPSEATLKAIVGVAQSSLAHASCEFMEQKARELSLNQFLCDMLGKGNRKAECHKEQLPCFYVSMAMLHIAARMNIPVLLSVRRAAHTVVREAEAFDTHLFYKLLSDGKNGKSALIDPNKVQEVIKPDEPILVIDGQRCGKVDMESTAKEGLQDYQKRLQKHDLFDLVAFNAISHPQYMEDDCDIAKITLLGTHGDEKKRLVALKAHAIEQGFSERHNQSCLAIFHIFPSTLRREIETKKIEVKP